MTEIQRLRVRDPGDSEGHLSSVATAHPNIEQAVAGALSRGQPFAPVIVGGANPLAAPAVRSFCAANRGKKVGAINFDAHF